MRLLRLLERQQTANIALERGIIDRAVLDYAEIVPELTQGDIVFIAVPTLSVPAVVQVVAETTSPAVTLTDGASVKGSVYQALKQAYTQIPPQFVLGHPIAGSEQSGVEAANPDLYHNHRVILTPSLTETAAAYEQHQQHLQTVTALWQQVGAEVLTMPIDEHDDVLAATSHLPHAIAFSLVDTLPILG